MPTTHPRKASNPMVVERDPPPPEAAPAAARAEGRIRVDADAFMMDLAGGLAGVMAGRCTLDELGHGLARKHGRVPLELYRRMPHAVRTAYSRDLTAREA